jgi:hypothetical protein
MALVGHSTACASCRCHTGTARFCRSCSPWAMLPFLDSSRIVRSQILVQAWLERLPKVAEVRPKQCPCCGNCPEGGGCSIHGHGKRRRALWGPPSPGQPPSKRAVLARRFRCLACLSLLYVVPAEIGPQSRFGLATILFALAAWVLEQRTPGSLLVDLSPSPRQGNSDPWLWSSLRRWVRRRAVLFPQVAVPDRATIRETAAELVAAMVARMPRAPPVATPAAAWSAALHV